MKNQKFAFSVLTASVLMCFSSTTIATPYIDFGYFESRFQTIQTHIQGATESFDTAKPVNQQKVQITASPNAEVLTFKKLNQKSAVFFGRNIVNVFEGAELTVSGSSIMSEGGAIFVATEDSSTAKVGSKDTKSLNINVGDSAADAIGNSTIEFDAQEISIKATKSLSRELLNSKGGSTIAVGRNANKVNLLTYRKGEADENLARTAYGIKTVYDETSNVGGHIELKGKSITLDVKAEIEAIGTFASAGSQINIGDESTDSVAISTISTKKFSDYANLKPNKQPDAKTFKTYGLWVDRQKEHDANGGQLTVNAHNSINISAEGTTDVRGVHVGTNELTPTKLPSKLSLKAQDIRITAISNDQTKRAIGISAMSAGQVEIIGNTTITADDVIVARGNSKIDINTNSGNTHSTTLVGDINFSFDKLSSGTAVDANVNVNLTGQNSSWTGNSIVTWGEPTTNPDETLKVTGLNVSLSDGASWTPTAKTADPTNQAYGMKPTNLNSLNMDNGVVNLTQDVNVTVEQMNGSGSVNLATDTSGTATPKAGSFTVQNAAANSSMTINLMDSKLSRKLTADEIQPEEATALKGNVKGQISTTLDVPEGFIAPSYGVDASNKILKASKNTLMESSLEIASATPLALNRIMMNDVRKRLGDLRTTNSTHGAWARYDGGKLSGNGLENEFNTLQVGIDTVPTTDAPRVGVSFSYTEGDVDYLRGIADMTAYSLALYGTWMGDNGLFADVIGRMGVAKSDMTVDGKHKGKMDNVVIGLSGELGWRLDLNDRVYVEPQTELTYFYVNEENMALSTANYKVDATHSLLGRVGFATGMKCPNNYGNVYVRASVVHEFMGDAKISGSNNGLTNVYEMDGKDTWVEYGLGANFNITDNTYLWADVEHTTGGTLDEDWRATCGMRFSW